jgi:hypothetical protein
VTTWTAEANSHSNHRSSKFNACCNWPRSSQALMAVKRFIILIKRDNDHDNDNDHENDNDDDNDNDNENENDNEKSQVKELN